MKPYVLLFFLVFGILGKALAQDAETIVQQQLEAYNAKDLDAFMAVFHEDVVFYRFDTGEPFAEGWEAVRALFAKLFADSPELHSNVVKRIVLGNTVIDHEHITGRQGNAELLELVMIYEVREGKIYKATSLRKQ